MSEQNELTGYLEDCCWTWIRDQCKGGACACRCHTDYPNRLAKHQYSGALKAVTELSAALAAAEARAAAAEQKLADLLPLYKALAAEVDFWDQQAAIANMTAGSTGATISVSVESALERERDRLRAQRDAERARADAAAQDWDSERLAYRRIARAYVGLLESDYPESHWGENYHQAVALLAAQQVAEGPHEFDGACRNVQHADSKCACNHPVNGRRCGQNRYAPIHRDAAPTAAPGATDANV